MTQKNIFFDQHESIFVNDDLLNCRLNSPGEIFVSQISMGGYMHIQPELLIPNVISYRTLRRGVGVLGMGLPFILAIGAFIIAGDTIQDSVSAYYHTVMGDVFVGILFSIGFFLFSYKGYEGDEDNIVSNLSWLFAIGVALFPTTPTKPEQVAAIENLNVVNNIGNVHLVFAALFFLTLVYFALFLFTKSAGTLTQKKKQRNIVYRVCGVIMLVSLILIAIFKIFFGDMAFVDDLNLVFWLEAVAIEAFGVSWLIKGDTLLRD